MAGTTGAAHNEAITCKIQGNINYRQENYEEALLFYEKGLKIDPGNIDIWNNKGLALIKLGRVEEAGQCKLQMKRLGENPGKTHATSPAITPGGSEKPARCTIKIKGVEEQKDIPENKTATDTTGSAKQALHGDLHFREIEQNIESIQGGLDKVRHGRIKEAEHCKLQIKEMEETIEQTKQGLDLVKSGRIEEARKIKYIEDHIELTKKGLEQIKIGRMEEASHYKQQLEAIEEKIRLARNSLQQVKSGEAATGMGSKPGAKVTVGNTEETRKLRVPIAPVMAESGTNSMHQIEEIEEIIGFPHEGDQPVNPNRIRLAGILFVFFVVLFLAYFAFFK
ncbi:MAG: tetratricopeptide repeat protein [Methanomicrobiales archaeon]